MIVLLSVVCVERNFKISDEILLPKTGFYKMNNTLQWSDKNVKVINCAVKNNKKQQHVYSLYTEIEKLKTENLIYKDKVEKLESYCNNLNKQNNDILDVIKTINKKISDIFTNQDNIKNEINQIAEKFESISLEFSLIEKNSPSSFSDMDRINNNIVNLQNRIYALEELEISARENNDEFHLIEIQKYLYFLVQKIENLEKFQVNIVNESINKNIKEDLNKKVTAISKIIYQNNSFNKNIIHKSIIKKNKILKKTSVKNNDTKNINTNNKTNIENKIKSENKVVNQTNLTPKKTENKPATNNMQKTSNSNQSTNVTATKTQNNAVNKSLVNQNNEKIQPKQITNNVKINSSNIDIKKDKEINLNKVTNNKSDKNI